MEADILRLILLLVGAALVFGIYLFDRLKNKKSTAEATQDWMSAPQEQPMADHIEPSWDSLNEKGAEPDAGQAVDETQPEDAVTPDTQVAADLPPVQEAVPEQMEKGISSELEQLEEIIHDEPDHGHRRGEELDEDTPSEQMSISFFASEIKKQRSPEPEVPLPVKIIQLNIVPHEEEFYGDDILCVVQEVGLELGEMNVFHHYGDDPEKHQPIFSMASMVEPGTFPRDGLDGFSTPGLTLFMRLPGPKDGLSIFADMLHAAEQLATLMDGELRDEAHGALSKQTIGHIREEIQEHHRQLQLVRSKQ
ncbi:MAG: cell division protein ZipA [Gammaproteobacteria bacterium]|nr:cell division protein ZipA [Gammaproteobacteria bacterium]